MINNPLYNNGGTPLPEVFTDPNSIWYNDPNIRPQQSVSTATTVPVQPIDTGAWAQTRAALGNMTWGGLLDNAINNAQQIGTGLQTVWAAIPTIPSQLMARGAEYAYDPSLIQQDINKAGQYLKNSLTVPLAATGQALTGNQAEALQTLDTNPNLARDFINFTIGQYGLGTNRMADVASGNITPDEYYAGMVRGLYQNPVSAGIDLLPVPSVGGVGKAIKSTGRTIGSGANRAIRRAINPNTTVGKAISNNLPDFSGAGKNVARSIDAGTQAGSSQAGKISDLLDNSFKGLDNAQSARVVESAETGLPLTNPAEITAKENLKSSMKQYDSLVPDYAKVDPKEIAITQKYARDNNITYNAARRELAGFEDLVAESPVVARGTEESGHLLGSKPEDYSELYTQFTKETEVPLPKINTLDESKQLIGLEDIPDGTLINLNGTYRGQSSKVQEVFDDVLGTELNTNLRNATGQEMLDYLNSKTGSPQATSDLLREAGLSGATDGSRTTIFGGQANGGYNYRTNTIDYFNTATQNTSRHEPFHWFTDKLIDASENNPALKSQLDRAFGVDVSTIKNNPTTYRNFQEKLTDEFLRYKDANDITNLTPAKAAFFDKIKTGLKSSDAGLTRTQKIEQLAQGGNRIAQQVLEAERLYDNGDIFPVTHAGDEALETVTGEIAEATPRLFADRFSSREFGNASYQEIAQRLQNNEGWLRDRVRDYTQSKIANEIADSGTLGGNSIAPVDARDTFYLSRDRLRTGDLKTALRRATKEGDPATNPDLVPVSGDTVRELQAQLYSVNSPLNGLLGDISSAIRTSMLSQGLYLAGNAITGATNAVINSSTGLINDALASIATRGKLARELGLKRVDRPRRMATPIGELTRDFNMITGGNLLRYLDRNIQNTFAEIAANASLRRAGVPVAERVNAINNMNIDQLTNTINDVRQAALLNSPRTIVPRSLYPFLDIVQPFWRWYDTATQSTYHMLKNHPLMANVALVDILSTIGWNTELQNRYNLRVESDKPMVTYKFDPKTQKIMELSGDITPMMSTLRFAVNTGDMLRGKGEPSNLLPAGWGDIINAAQGKDRYGNKLKNAAMVVQGGKRYQINEQTGRWEEVQGGTPSEIFVAGVRNLFGIPNMVNRTLAPAATGLLNKFSDTQYNYYRPYAGSLFGEVLPEGQAPSNPNVLFGGNPTAQRTPEDLRDALMGMYATEYYPERPDNVRSRRELQSILRARARRNTAIQESVNR